MNATQAKADCATQAVALRTKLDVLTEQLIATTLKMERARHNRVEDCRDINSELARIQVEITDNAKQAIDNAFKLGQQSCSTVSHR